MATEELIGTKLWIERHENPNDSAAKAKPLHYQYKNITFSAHDLKDINLALKKNQLSFEAFIHAAYIILLSRLSTTDSIIYGTGSYHHIKKNSWLQASNLFPCKISINESTKLNAFFEKITALIGKKKGSSPKLPSEVRYLLLQKAIHSKSGAAFADIDLNHYTLALLLDIKHPKQLEFAYHPHLFHAEEAIFLIAHLKIIIKNMCADPEQLVVNMNILTTHEKNKELKEWSQPHYKFKIPKITQNIHELIGLHAKQTPDLLAVNHALSTLTYKDLNQAAISLAYALIAKGIKPGDCICVHMERTSLWIVAMIAIFKAGGIYVPINPKFPNERIEYVLNDCKPKLILIDHNQQHLPNQERYVTHTVSEQDLFNIVTDQSSEGLPIPSPDDMAYILYTSGTTGSPKGVMVKHSSLNNLIAWYQGCFKVKSSDRSVQFASQGFDSHLCEVIPFLGSGASVHIVDDNTKLTPELFFEWLQENKITVCDIPTAYAQILFGLNWPEPITLRLMKIGGESLTRYPDKNLPFEIWNGYGPTEATVEATYFKLPHISATKKKNAYVPSPSIGKPISEYKVYIVDSHLQPVPIGVAGEILIGGSGLASGYLNREELTLEKFIVNPFNTDPNDKLYRTGDLGRWLKDGNIEFIGRKDNQVKIRGYRIELNDIESALMQYPDVSEAVVLVKEGIDYGKSLIAYIVPNLDKERYLFQERCLISLNKHKYVEAISEDISKGGLALTGISETIPVGKIVHLHLKLPGLNEAKDFTARLIWQIGNRCGFVFDCPDDQMVMIAKSIDYYLATHNMMEMVLSAKAKRSLKKALKNRLPEYMIPNTLITMLEFPHTFSGKIDTKSLPLPQEYEKILHHEYIPPKTATEKKLCEIWHAILGKDHISMSDNFFDIGGSSLSAAQLSVKILNHFHITVPAKILFDLSYVPILAEYIDSKGEQYSKQSLMQEDIQRDCILPDNITPTKKLNKHINDPQNILLTGAGGFLGVYLLRQLLATSQAKVYCLIRKGEFDTAAKRLMATIQKFNLGQDVSLNDRRIVAIASDLCADNFGLPLEQYNSLLDKIDLIYHCGAQVNIMASYNKLRGSNVVGTLEVIKFATTRVDKPIHYVSTLSSAYQRDLEGSLSEVYPEATYEELSGGYAISKWVAERLLTEAKNRGLPIQIYRSGYISGQMSNGQANLNDALFMLMKGCIQLGFAPNMAEKVTILPVDYVSEAIIGLSLHHPTRSAVYHLDHPTGIMWPDLIAWINQYGYPVKIVSIEEWQKMLPSIPIDNALFPFLPYYLALPKDYRSDNVDVTHATTELTKLNLPYPAINNELLTVYFDFMCQDGFLTPPEGKKSSTKA